MLRRGALLACMCLVGCQDPESARLASGQRAILVHPGGQAQLSIKDDEPTVKTPDGTQIIVLDDTAKPWIKGEESLRFVRVKVLDGPFSGAVGTAHRLDVKPLRSE